jgi:putative transposase
MPWLNTGPMEQKVAFVKAALTVPRGQMSALCERYGIARKTGYKWLKRYREAEAVQRKGRGF